MSDKIIINEKYEIDKKVGEGSFGIIFKAKDLFTKKDFALKFEDIYVSVPQLYHEYKIYKKLNISFGVPKVYDYINSYKTNRGVYNIMVMDYFENSLENLFDKCNRKFSLKTTILLAIQMLKRITFLHNKNYVHRDLKPDNFMIDKNNNVFLIDIGMTKLYRDSTTNHHIPYRENKSLSGTPRYASINTHLGIEYSRRDDLESIGYIIVYFLKGKLPWQGLVARDKRSKYRKIMEKKMATPIDYLCTGLPPQIITYFEYVRHLRFMDRPNYEYLVKLFKDILIEKNIQLNNTYDWDTSTIPEEINEDIDVSDIEKIDDDADDDL